MMVVMAVAGFAAGSIIGALCAAFALSRSVDQSRDQAGLVIEMERLRAKDRFHADADTPRDAVGASGNAIATSSRLERLQNND
jgi:hypothetical protein